MKTFGIIILVIYIFLFLYVKYIMRTTESTKQFLDKVIKTTNTDKKISHYIGYVFSSILDLSIIGYVIYALTQI